MNRLPIFIIIVIFTLLLWACSPELPATCPDSTPIGLEEPEKFVLDDQVPFRFPLDVLTSDGEIFFGWFGVSNECPPNAKDCYEYPERAYHAAEDYQQPAGTPVYAMADGQVRYSAPAGGYGWLVIINHPQANLYSLYGHLSPSRWSIKSGTEVKKGDLIAYLGNPDENGGSAENPLVPHLHFGLRAGQMENYPRWGEWRFMAGWIQLCPQDLGWLQPSLVINSQNIPPGGFSQPEVPFLERWRTEMLITGIYLPAGVGMLVYALKKHSLILTLASPVFLIAAWVVLTGKGITSSPALLVIGLLLLVFGLLSYFRVHPGRIRNVIA